MHTPPPLTSPNRSKWPPILLIIDFLNHPWPPPYLIPCIETVAPCRVPNFIGMDYSPVAGGARTHVGGDRVGPPGPGLRDQGGPPLAGRFGSLGGRYRVRGGMQGRVGHVAVPGGRAGIMYYWDSGLAVSTAVDRSKYEVSCACTRHDSCCIHRVRAKFCPSSGVSCFADPARSATLLANTVRRAQAWVPNLPPTSTAKGTKV